MINEFDQVDILAWSVFRDLEEVDYACESRTACETRGDVRERDLPDRGDLDRARTEPVAVAYLHARTLPDAHAAGDFAAHDGLAQSPGEHHEAALRMLGGLHAPRIIIQQRRQPALRLDDRPSLAGGVILDLIALDLADAEISAMRLG